MGTFKRGYRGCCKGHEGQAMCMHVRAMLGPELPTEVLCQPPTSSMLEMHRWGRWCGGRSLPDMPHHAPLCSVGTAKPPATVWPQLHPSHKVKVVH